MTASALFEGDGSLWTPTDLASGPWDPAHCHGGPPAALLARAVECHHDHSEEGIEWQVARMTIELLRPIHVGRTLSVESRTERPGRRVSLVEARLLDGDTEVAAVRALRVRERRDDFPDSVVPSPSITVPPELADPQVADFTSEATSYVRDACEFRFASGGWNTLGPSSVWIRLTVPLVADEAVSPLQRVAAAADFGNGVSADVDFSQWLYINPDLTIHLARPLRGEWVGLQARSHLGGTGTGLAHSALHDTDGTIGMSLQSLLVEPRG